jgi:hypothetical protein
MADELSRVRWWARRLAERAGPAGIAAGVLGLLVLGAWAGPGRTMPAQARALALDNEALLRRPAMARPIGAPLATERQLAAFEARFPDARALNTSYARLWALAQRHGVVLRQAEFKLGEAGSDEFLRYGIQLPVTADYAALRGFVVDALRELPSLALEEMSLRREDSKSARLDARLRFVLLVRRGGA